MKPTKELFASKSYSLPIKVIQQIEQEARKMEISLSARLLELCINGWEHERQIPPSQDAT